MKRFFAPTLVALIAFTQSASAIVGGPFDMGLHSAQLENGVYQAAMTYKNGNGFCYFSPTANIVSPLGPQDTAGIANRGEINNRAVLYYKGITYVGSAFGMADPDANYIQCSINGSSELVNTTTTQNNNNGFFFGSSSTSSSSSSIVTSNRGFGVNGSWEAKFKQTAPVKRFIGKGELVFLAPTGPDAIAGLAFTGYSNLINAITTSVGNAGSVGLGSISPGLYEDAQLAIDSALDSLGPRLAGAGLDATLDNGDAVKIRIRGTMRY
jgi:hypothetical protein